MARCLFKASAVTLNSQYTGIDLMIPLILKDGRISFIGIQVKFVKEDCVKMVVDDATEKMTFSKMFKGESDRPFGLIILALGDYFENKLEVSLERSEGSTIAAPAILVLKGIPNSFQYISSVFFEGAPQNYSYHGICYNHLKSCDRLFEIVHELPLSPEELAALSQYGRQTWSAARKNESRKSKSRKRPKRTLLRPKGD